LAARTIAIKDSATLGGRFTQTSGGLYVSYRANRDYVTSVPEYWFRKSLPPGFAREDFDRSLAQEISRCLLERLAANPDCGPILDHFADRWISASAPLLNGQMDQLALVDQLTIESVVGARSSAVFRIEKHSSSTSVHAFARKITFPAHADSALRFALSQPRFPIRDLPGNVDENGKLVLVRRLVREGLMVVLAV